MVGFKRNPFHRQNTGMASGSQVEEISGVEDTKGGSVSKTGITSGAEINEFEVEDHLKHFQQNHHWDPNLPEGYSEQVTEALKAHDVEAEIAIERGLAEQSPYPEVQAAVRNYDEDMPCNTVRAWVIGMLLTTVGSALNMLFSMRNPSIQITSIVAQIVAYPLGVAWEKVMPKRVFTTFGLKWTLNTGPFNLKEHTIIVVMANASFGNGAAYSTDILLAQQVYYGQNFGWGYQLLLTWTTTMIGYGLAGIARRFLVWPAAMIWPSNLVNTTLFYALHDHTPADPSKTGGWSIGRYRYFLYVFAGSFVWYWFPGWIFQALSVFTFVCFIRPDSVVINQIFGGISGLALIPLTFDWTTVTGFVLSPLIPPWHAIANTLFGCIVFFWFTALGLHYTGAFYAEYLPMSASGVFDNQGKKYNVSRILTDDYLLDEAAYHAYSPLYLSTTFSIAYGLSFATMISLIVHTAIYNGKEIYLRAKLAREQEDDVHMRLMKKYRDAPDWWYFTLFGIMFALGFVVCYAWDTHLTGWAYLIAIIIPLIWSIPIGMIQAVTNIAIGLNVLTEFIIGYMQPGRPLAMMMFKCYGYMTMYQGLAFVQDLKLGHYMKIPPRTMFWTQTIATLWSGLVQIAVLNWALGAITDVCSADNTNSFTCPNATVFFSASVIWGLIGPARIFSPGATYGAMLWFFLLGALLPVALWGLSKKFPKSFFRYMMAPVIFGGTGNLPPATPINYLSWGIIGYIFNKLIKGRQLGWWSHYNYITSAGLDAGLAISTIVIFFTLQLTNANPIDWWGNNVQGDTLDANPRANIQTIIPKSSTFRFGPQNGNFP